MVTIKKLSNGMPVIYERVSSLRSVSLGLCVKVGSRDEPESKSGISHFVEHMLFKGTTNRSYREISELIDGIGGELNAFTSRETTVLHTTVLDKNIEIAIDLLSDIVLNSTFKEEEVEKEKNVIIEEIKMYEDLPEDQVHESNIGNALKRTRLSSPIIGNEEKVRNINREDLVEWFNEHYTSNKMFLSIVGHFDIVRVHSLLEGHFCKLSRVSKSIEAKGAFELSVDNKEVTKKTNQVHICVNTKGLSHPSKDIFKLYIASNIVGGGSSSRLFQRIREERGLAYSIYSYLSCYRDGGLFTTYIGTSKGNYKEALDITLEEYKKISQGGVSEKELERSKNQIISSLVLDLEGSKSQMFRNMNLYFSTEEVKPFNKMIKQIQRITLRDVSTFCNEHFDDKYYSFTALGDL